MKNITFELNNYNLQILQKKNSIYSYLNSKFNKAHFKLADGVFVFSLCSGDGIIKTTLNVDYTGETKYFTLEYPKWVAALQKFSLADTIKLELNKNLLRMSVDGSNDIINLSIIIDDEDSDAARKINTFVSMKKDEIVGAKHHMILTPSLLADFDIMCSLFAQQSRINSIGICKTDVIYCDRATIVKSKFAEPLSDELFNNLESEEKYIALHSYIVKLLELVSSFNIDVYFDRDYELLYWSDENTELIIYSDDKSVAFPTDEQYNSILPSNRNTHFDVNINQLADSLNFFVGFYEGSSWRPLKFSLAEGKEVLLNYNHPTADIKKSLTDVIAPKNGEFSVDSDTLGKIITKIKKRFSTDNVMINVYYDETAVSGVPAPGVFATVEDSYEFMLSRLSDN